eukprot:TRINITY_DN5438_c0_g1_i1.p1 TRINITY_DN5438_c0_g1~~TRINITY_DN5438_c0_g1_i1.p1  ORF type:complete len:396 (+),score=64.49 TRINITY_DN5438_c0_g1_i1:95-1282(+)
MSSYAEMENLSYTSWVCPAPSNIFLLLSQPKVYVGFVVALPCAILGAGLKFIQKNYDETFLRDFIKDDAAFGCLTLLVVFISAFRITKAYNKFWDGCGYVYNINGDLFDAAADLVAFTRCAKASPKRVHDFHHLLIRLTSLLHALICADLDRGAQRTAKDASKTAPSAYSFELIDISAVDQQSLDSLLDTNNKVEMVFQWIQNIVVEGWNDGVFGVPAPIMSRAFEDMGSAMVHFHEAQKITEVPFPFPYMMALQILLIWHWMLTPLVTAQWSDHEYWVFAFCLTGTFSLWFFVGLAMELDMPFNSTRNSLDMRYMQKLMNHRLLVLISTFKKEDPSLSSGADFRLGRRSLTKSGAGGIAESAQRRTSVRRKSWTQGVAMAPIPKDDIDAIKVIV